MKRYHRSINDETVECDASVQDCPKDHVEAPNLQEATAKFEAVNKLLFGGNFKKLSRNETQPNNTNPGMATSFNERPLRTKDELDRILDTYQDFPVYTGATFDKETFHITSKEAPDANRIRSVENNTHYMGLDKPHEALWCSLGEPYGDDIKPSWQIWMEIEDYPMDNMNIHQVKLKDNATILELTDDNVHLLADERIPAGIALTEEHQDDEYKTNQLLERFPMESSFRHIDWVKLKESGIDAVRVNGLTERNHFSGWDVDSFAVLNGEAVQSIHQTR